MLLATYAIATLTIEQTCERTAIRRLQESMQQALASNQFDPCALSMQSERLILLAESRHWRRLENCLIPALREASNDALLFLQALESLGRAGVDMLPVLRDALLPAAGAGQQHIARACATVNSYCQNLLQRLAFEEQQLLPLAQRLLATDAWFRVGTQFLMQDAHALDGAVENSMPPSPMDAALC
jgi:hemerythrin-like domain-containing protein